MDLEFLDPAIERKKRLENALNILKEKIKEIEKVLPDVEIYVFGSYAEGKYDILSDVDVAIVTKKKEEEIRVLLQKILGSPFEIHLFDKKEWEEFRKTIKKYIKIK